MPEDIRQWMCDGEHFEDDEALARHLAGRIGAGQVLVSFSRLGCWFRLGFEGRIYTVTLVTNSPHCAGGNVFTATWPDGYASEPVDAPERDAPDDTASVDRTMQDVSRVLTSIGTALWPDLYGV